MFITHSVYLALEERKLLTAGACTLETVGITTTSTKDKSGEEIFGHYLLTNELKEGPEIEKMPDGFKVYISPRQCRELLPLPDGIESLNLKIEQTENEKKVYHQVTIQPISLLEQSIVIGEFVVPKLACPANDSKVIPEKAVGETRWPSAH